MTLLTDPDAASRPLVIEQLVLERLEFAGQISLPRQVALNLSLQEFVDFAVPQITNYIVRSWLPGLYRYSGNATATFRVPATWWDHFRQSMLPAWINRRWPPQLRTEYQPVTFKVYEVAPEWATKMPSIGKTILVAVPQ